MADVELFIMLLAGVVGLVWLAGPLRVPYPVLLVVGGLGVGLIPFLPDVRVDPARPGFAMQRMWVVDRAPARLVLETLQLPHTLMPPAAGSVSILASQLPTPSG